MKKILSIVLTLALVLTFIPTTAFAAADDPIPANTETINVGETKTIGSLSEGGNFYYKFSLTKTSKVVITCVVTNGSGEPNPARAVFNLGQRGASSELIPKLGYIGRTGAPLSQLSKTSNGMDIAESGPENYPMQGVYYLAPGDYYINAYVWSVYVTSPYTMKVTLNSITEIRNDGADSKGAAPAITVNHKGLTTLEKTTLDPCARDHFYKFTLANADRVSVAYSMSPVYGEASGFGSFTIENLKGEKFYSSGDIPEGKNGAVKAKTVTVSLPKGTYYLCLFDGWSTYATKHTFKIKSLNIPATKLTINKASVTIKKGGKIALKITKFAPAAVVPKTITWTTSNKKVATVDKNGVVKGIKAGPATITAKSWNGTTVTCKVTVK